MFMREDYPLKQTFCRRAAHKNVPVNGAFELTPRCSLNCKMCYIRMTPEQMRPIGRERSAEEWIALAREARDMGMTFLLLTGGEPFLRKDLFPILEALNKMGIIVDINSNGTLIDEAVADRLLSCPPSKINITLYGASRESYGRLCGDPSAFDRVVRAIQLLKERKILVCLNTTLTPENAHEMEDILAFAKNNDLVLRPTSYIIPPSRRGSMEKAYRLPPKEAGQLTYRIQLLNQGAEAMLLRAENQLLTEDCYYESSQGISCLAGRSQFWITWDGKMLPCGMLPGISASPEELGFAEAWRVINDTVRNIPGCKECNGCNLRSLCPACAASRYCENGDMTKRCDYLCQFSEAYRDELAKLAEAHRG